MNRPSDPRNLSTRLGDRIIERPIGYPCYGVREASRLVTSAAVRDIARRSDQRWSSGSGSRGDIRGEQRRLTELRTGIERRSKMISK